MNDFEFRAWINACAAGRDWEFRRLIWPSLAARDDQRLAEWRAINDAINAPLPRTTPARAELYAARRVLDLISHCQRWFSNYGGVDRTSFDAEQAALSRYHRAAAAVAIGA